MPTKKRTAAPPQPPPVLNSSFLLSIIGVVVCIFAMLLAWQHGYLGKASTKNGASAPTTATTSATTAPPPMRLMNEVYMDFANNEIKTRIVTAVDPFAQYRQKEHQHVD